MPLYSEEWDFDKIDDEIIKVAEKYGFIELQHALKRLDLLNNEEEKEKIKKNVLLEVAIDFYFGCDDFNNLAPSSQQAYRYEMNLFSTHCLKHKGLEPYIMDVSSPLFLSEYLKSVKKQNTKSKKSAFLRGFLRVTYEHFFNLDIKKIKKVLQVKVDKNRLPRAFRKEQIDEITTLSRLGREPFRNFTVLWVFLGTGIRLNELCNLQVGDIKPQLQEIQVLPKGDKNRKEARKITKFSLDLICKYIHFRYGALKQNPGYNELYIFSVDQGITPIHDSTVQTMLGNLIKEAKTISEDDKKNYQFSVHSLRHSFALYLLESGVDIYTIKELLNHKWLSSTTVYLKLYDDMLVKAIDKHPLGNLKVNNFFPESG
jgi:integrase/recombinase XerD